MYGAATPGVELVTMLPCLDVDNEPQPDACSGVEGGSDSRALGIEDDYVALA